MKSLELTIEDNVAHVILNRPEARNAMDANFWVELPKLFGALSENCDVRAIVISAAGPHFSAGMDVNYLAEIGDSEDSDVGRSGLRLRQMILDFQACFDTIDRCPIPVLSAVHGACVGGGVDLVCTTDIRYCTENAYFCIQEINIGMTADVGTLQRMPKLIPSGLMHELAYTGRRLDSGTALNSGFVTRVFASQDEMLEQVLLTAKEIACKSPLAVLGSKEMLRYARDHSTSDGLNYIATWNASMLRTEDLAEGMQAAGDKRAPNFRGRLRRRPLG